MIDEETIKAANRMLDNAPVPQRDRYVSIGDETFYIDNLGKVHRYVDGKLEDA